jgi:hypothetical protein
VAAAPPDDPPPLLQAAPLRATKIKADRDRSKSPSSIRDFYKQ